MHKDKELRWFLVGLGIVVGMVIGDIVGTTGATNSYQAQATQTSCAQFSPETGEFEWLPKELKK